MAWSRSFINTSTQIILIVSAIHAVSLTGMAGAAQHAVEFDVPALVACRDVTTDSFSKANPRERMIEATFRVSTLISATVADSVEELLIVIASRDHQLSVIDFSPRTELHTDVAGEIDIVENHESTKSLNAHLGGRASLQYGVTTIAATPTVGGVAAKKESFKESYRRLPSRQLLLASGTVDGAHGVFFKLRRSPRSSLEGARQFSCTFVAPADWQASSVVVGCRAQANVTRFLARGPVEVGRTELPAVLYLDGNSDAKSAAQRLVKFANGRTDSTGKKTTSDAKGAPFALGPFRIPNLFQLCVRAEAKSEQRLDHDAAKTPAPETPAPNSPGM